jgi:hypothetical protein
MLCSDRTTRAMARSAATSSSRRQDIESVLAIPPPAAAAPDRFLEDLPESVLPEGDGVAGAYWGGGVEGSGLFSRGIRGIVAAEHV